MLRLLNVIAILALLGSAVYAYSIKYETILTSEQIIKIRHAIDREKNLIVTLKSDWAYLTRPERIQILAEKHLDLRQMSLDQIVKVTDLPDKAERVDSIGRKLEMLGLSEPTATPRDDKSNSRAGSTPSATTPSTRLR
jgi:cell division protein FtsL